MESEAARKYREKSTEFYKAYNAFNLASGGLASTDAEPPELDEMRDELDALFYACRGDECWVAEQRARIAAGENPRIEVIVYHKLKGPIEVTRIVEAQTGHRLDVDGFIEWHHAAPKQIEGANLVVIRYETDPDELPKPAPVEEYCTESIKKGVTLGLITMDP